MEKDKYCMIFAHMGNIKNKQKNKTNEQARPNKKKQINAENKAVGKQEWMRKVCEKGGNSKGDGWNEKPSVMSTL